MYSTFFRGIFLVVISCTLASTQGVRRSESTSGMDFFFAIPSPLSSSYSPNVFISTLSDIPVQVSIDIPGIGFKTTASTSRSTQAKVVLPTASYLSGTGIQDRTIHVRADSHVTIVACNTPDHAIDGFLILPKTSLGREYVIASYVGTSSSPSEFSITALDEVTSVYIKTKQGSILDFSLAPFKSYQFQGGNNDLTGSFILTNKPVMVVSGTKCAHVPSSDCGTLLEVMPSIKSLGKQYILSPFMARTSGYFYRVIATSNTTTNVVINNNAPLNLEAGEFYHGDVADDSVITIQSNEKILVSQYVKDRSTDGYGDPSMTVVPPVENFSHNTSFPVVEVILTSGGYEIKYYISVTLKCDYVAGLVLDESISMSEWNTLTSNNGDMCVVRGEVNAAGHSVGHPYSGALFSVAVYSMGYPISYSYPASFDFSSGRITLSSDYFSASEEDGIVHVTLTNTEFGVGTVVLQTTSGTGTEEIDFTPLNGTSITVPGKASTNVTIIITADGIAERTEYFTVAISGDTGSTTFATVEIFDSDVDITFSSSTLSVSEGDGTVDLILTNTGGGTASVGLQVFNGSATENADFENNNNVAVYLPAYGNETVSFSILDDNEGEHAETFNVTITPKDIGAITTVEITILDDDAVVEFTNREVSVQEGQRSAYLTLRNTGGSDGIVSLTSGGGSATEGIDYTSVDGLNVTVPAYGSTNIVIEILDDLIAETTEYFTVNIIGDTGDAASASIAILDQHEPPPTEPDINGMTLICDGTNMIAIFNTSSLPYTDSSEVHLLDENCVASDYGYNQAIISTDYHLCQTLMLESEGHMIFRNSLIVGAVDKDSPIDPPQVNIQCALERRYLVDTSYLASHKTHTSFGNFTFGLDIFESEHFRYAYRPEDYPVPMKVNDYVYLAARVFTMNTLDLFIDTCWATPSSDPWDDTSYSLILHGCQDESTVHFHDSNDPTVEQFSFRVFNFKEDQWLIYVHCQLLVCDVNTANSRCSQGCIEREKRSGGRMRRSESDLRTVSSGPLNVDG